MASNPFDYAERFNPANRPSGNAAEADAFDPVGAEIRRMREAEIRATVDILPDPDRTARVTRAARSVGLPPLLVEDALEHTERAAQTRSFMDLVSRSSSLGRWAVQNPRGAAAAQDDASNLSVISTAWDTFKGIGADVAGAFNAGANTAARGVNDLFLSIDEVLVPIANPSGAREILDRERSYSQQYTERAAAARPTTDNFWWQSALQGVESIPTSLNGLVVGLLTRSPGAAATAMGVTTGASGYQDALRAGKGTAEALRYGMVQGGTEGFTEAIPAGRWLDSIIKRAPVGKALLRSLEAELPGEQVATLVQDLSDWVTLHPDRPFSEYLAERPNAALSTAIATTVGTSVQVGATTAPARIIERVQGQFGAAQAARQERAAIDKVEQGARASNLRKRDPEAFRDLMRQQAEDAGASSVFIPGDAIREYQQSNSYDQNDDRFARYNVDEAFAAGGDIVIPIEDVLTDLIDSPAWAAVKDDVRLKAGGMSVREAQTFEDGMADLMAEMTGEMAQADRAEQDARTVREKIVDRVSELFGVSYTAPVARDIAELFAQRMQTRAAALGQPLTLESLDGFGVRQVMPEGVAEAVKADQLDVVIAAMRKGKDAEAGVGPSLLQFIADRGGINDSGGDLASMGAPKKLLRDFDPRQASMGGLSGAGDYGADNVLRAAIEAGFFPELANAANEAGASRIDTQVLLDAIREEIAGRPVYAETRTDIARAAADDLRAMLEDSGLSPDAMTDAQVREAVDRMAPEGMPGGYEQAGGILDDVLASMSGEKTRGFIDLGRVPAVLQQYGIPSGQLTIGRGKLKTIAGDHSPVPAEIIASLPRLLAKPWAVFPTTDKNHSDRVVVALQERDAVGDPVLVALQPQASGAVTVSVYGKQGSPIKKGDERVAEMIEAARKSGGKVMVVGSPPASYSGPIPDMRPERQRKPILSLGRPSKSFEQEARGRISFDGTQRLIELFQSRNLSTALHEMSHMWLEELRFDASLADAPEQVKADWQAVQRYFAANGFAMQGDQIPVEAHELFARSGERYLMEGKAPSPALTRLFETFRAWLTGIYKTVDRLRAPITPEIREVFDRLLATDEEIAAARERQSLSALFKDLADSGMSEAEFAAYQSQVEEARTGAHASLLDKTMRAIRRRETDRYRDARKAVRDEEQLRIDAAPLYRAQALMKAERVSREWIADEMGLEALDLLPVRVPPLHVSGGAHPDTIAERAGYSTGREMIEALIGAERAHRQAKEGGDKRSMRERAIETATDAEMNRRWGDPLNDGSIEREALAAVHSDMQGEVIAAELRILSRRTGRRATPYSVAREWARGKVRGGTVAMEASPSALQRYARNAAKAGRAAEQAMLKQDVEETFRQKQAQMMNNALLAEAKAAADEVEAAVKRMDKIARAKTRKSVDQAYLEQAQALLEAVDLRKRSQVGIDRQGKWEAFAAARQAEGFDIVTPPGFEATLGRTNWTRLAVDDLLALDETVKQVMHLGRLKQTLLDNKERRDREELIAEALVGADNIKGPPPQGLEDPTWWEGIKAKVFASDAMLLKMETVFDWLDGGNPNGVFNRIVFRPIADAQGRENDMTKDYHGRIKTLFEALPAKVVDRWSDKVAPPFIDRFTGKPMRLTRQKVISMALNTGNAGNLQRLADGFGVNETALVDYLANELTADEWTFVQGVWDTVETLWPEIEAMERRVNGVAPDKVEASEIVTPHGTFRGGYFPAIYDTRLDRKAQRNEGSSANELFEPNAVRASTRSSATKERAEAVVRPILLDLGVINRHLGEVIHDITHREAVMQAWEFLSNERVADMVDRALGREITNQFRPWVKFVANSWAMERAGNEAFGAWIGKLRANATAVGLGLRGTTMVTQIAGYSNSIEALGTKGEALLASAIARTTASPIETGRFVMEKSAEVRNRLDNLDRDIRTELARINARNPAMKALVELDNAKRFMFHGIGMMDRVVVIPTWIAAYNKALGEGMADAEAVYAADKVVRQSQGAGAPKDLAAISRGTGRWGEALKLFTMFYSFFSAQYQRQRTLGRDLTGADTRRPRNVPRLAARAFWMVVVPPLLVELLRGAVGAGGGPEDDEAWLQWLARKMLANQLGPIPLARDLFEPVWNRAAGNNTFNPSISPLQRFYDVAAKAGGNAGKVVRGEETRTATKDTLELAGYVTGLVPGQVASAAQFWVDVANDDVDPETVWDYWEGTWTGKLEED